MKMREVSLGRASDSICMNEGCMLCRGQTNVGGGTNISMEHTAMGLDYASTRGAPSRILETAVPC